MMKELELRRKTKRLWRQMKRKRRKRKKLRRKKKSLTGTPGNDTKRPKRKGMLKEGDVTDRR